MSKSNHLPLHFEIDKITNSIENATTREVFATIVSKLSIDEIKQIKTKDWVFNWRSEIKDIDNEVYKLETIQNPLIIHGLISLTDKKDHIYMNLIESAGFNKGRKKQYYGVAGNLVAHACKIAFEKNYEGVVSFVAKTKLIDHYKLTLGAKLFGGNRMFIDTKESKILVSQYFKDFNHAKY